MKNSVFFVMDPLECIQVEKDTTLAFMYEAFCRNYNVFITEPRFLSMQSVDTDQPEIIARARHITFGENLTVFDAGDFKIQSLHQASFVFMRQDPPVTIEYMNVTFILDFLEQKGVLVINHPGQVRGANEKLTALQFPECIPATRVSTDKSIFAEFLELYGDIVLKPLDGMGGQGVFRIKRGDQNLDSVIEVLTRNGQLQIMAQEYIPEISEGDKRILMIYGEPVPYALARVPQNGALRGNLAAGGKGIGVSLTDHDREICSQVGPWLKAHSIYFAGLDVIGRFLTEVNVTSPTCVRELDKIYNLNISGQLFDLLEKMLEQR